MSRRRLRHPEAARIGATHVGGPRPPFKPRFNISLCNRVTHLWAPRGYERTREAAVARLKDLLASDPQGLYDGGWIKQTWERS